MSTALTYAADGGVATISFNRPQVMNALDAEVIHALRAACERARDDAAVRAILLRGNGPAFVAGGDIAMFHANRENLSAMAEELSAELHGAILQISCFTRSKIVCSIGIASEFFIIRHFGIRLMFHNHLHCFFQHFA